MTTEQLPIRVSSKLKDLIGRDLITDDFVAVFELVKNSFDAHANRVRLHFGPDKIVVADNGKGMSRDAILKRWLFLAYSAKKDGTEDDDFRDRAQKRKFAGAKGIGRFSCDRLGSGLRLSSRAAGQPVQVLVIDWTKFEADAQREFADVKVDLSEADSFPEPGLKPPGPTGTVLEISLPRSPWPREKLQRLKRELAKLIDPFETGSDSFGIEIIAPAELQADKEDEDFNSTRRDSQDERPVVNGPVKNPIIEVIGKRTTGISVAITSNGALIETSLEDRGELIYRIRERNDFRLLASAGVRADIYFLNRSAKAVFARRMGLPAVQFGSIFVFRNGFRVFPIGAQDEDFFTLNRRKQQGVRRFLGGRDVVGRVTIDGTAGFDEATSRDGGLIRTPEVEELIQFVLDKCIKRLERYVVDITWKDGFDKDVGDISRMRMDANSALVAQLVARMAAGADIELLEYNADLVRIVDEKSSQFDASLKALELLAEKTGDAALVEKVDEAKARIKALQEAEAEAREAQRRAESRATQAERAKADAETRYGSEVERNAFLVAASSLDQDTILNLHHQILIHAAEIQAQVRLLLSALNAGKTLPTPDLVASLEKITFGNSRIITAARFATKQGYKHQSVDMKGDLAAYIRDYIETVSPLWAPNGIKVEVESDGKATERTFRPIDIGILIDNLVSNASKAYATKVLFRLEEGKSGDPVLEVTVADDGDGWPEEIRPLSRAFEKGVTTTDGSGLGLAHAKRIVENLRGTVEAIEEPLSDSYSGARILIRIPR